MSKNYNFSVIIPCYNLGNLLKGAVDSVLKQTLGNVEIIVVDDCSTDCETKDILRVIQKKIRVLYQKKNGGVAVARNAGVAISSSEYILCLDADDTIEPTYLEKAKKVFDSNEKVGIVTCHLKAHGEFSWISKFEEDINIVKALTESPVHTASCFRKSAWKMSGGYSEDLRGFEDWDFWIGIIKNNWKVRVVPEVLFFYLTRPDSKVKTSSKNARQLTNIIVNHHRELYEKYCDQIFAEKHAKMEELTSVVNRLREESVSKDNKTKKDFPFCVFRRFLKNIFKN